MLKLEDAQIVSNISLTKDFYLITFKAPKIAVEAKPGQFINVKVSPGTDPLLRRPIGILDADPEKGIIKALYFIKGKGTNILKERVEGERVSLTGPHGNGFTVSKESKNILLVGGGFGVSPLHFFASRNQDKNIFVAIGGRSAENILLEDDFKKLGAKVLVATDDGSYGDKGLVTKRVEEIIVKNKIDEVLTVGPIPMMKAVAEIAANHQIPCQVTMEERMACGSGFCFACVCKTKQGYKTVCLNGPVFNAEDLEW
ncbi:MAG: Dihydroorotate dehydrogenase B (NAD(+)), electron transfer subunit [candidate division CPR2 bacterium GW2011_GWC1_41_48]|uniref:Dihydroorotate dehydrogenase B (NAD(+)), electron transfer subunit n=1 Tax=candidate division CPR2 bacterium GW2011_GWC1_41_48 TaxID=1618344 RepID=A0A0G0Z8T1_UNCC2|nr:MAG: Dihydroorotate dehydrogenase B (NAD(+)), electron transfer subunit [candidate division CPR2 bacterium GW2011_GWC2_39_35]KKR28981.1 MAG: Dihydroorotate dehydrogenase B (NAD(+)), electron transfer subunit [candidate division CPR2 bacterium GW2011_GWD2_39_7]KKR29257.1 MAG: Dihydroorotate dehydrogenase B (NAD(+)), electron transfer subunit [candidate division CPR2 bacterium GW2011_GWD1_39_7]KKS09478.1 MAG: Dihydroorotate dehydrogenase B (NAD(+)), electron transfer subunit [candidate division